jgi:hypothetical protein
MKYLISEIIFLFFVFFLVCGCVGIVSARKDTIEKLFHTECSVLCTSTLSPFIPLFFDSLAKLPKTI